MVACRHKEVFLMREYEERPNLGERTPVDVSCAGAEAGGAPPGSPRGHQSGNSYCSEPDISRSRPMVE